ncbi:hypothetical protein DL766_001442 [Monosporascus sp. MC13-8B]|uniref:Uncharacterized protein n=1 Tax=Monosporascus cannonballus TaxID=155416 RepID=A0ABY0HC23_9PEZI|nr:hypothetical protein DL762_003078 [Monosporascus cannonballus]RYP00443.1 hypothetical protein DL763_000795 [Monosporascus cannonballus]RYP37626.1 hypothetical protein DL766_001442 [Monosporascus sp. MC13-8B]
MLSDEVASRSLSALGGGEAVCLPSRVHSHSWRGLGDLVRQQAYVGRTRTSNSEFWSETSCIFCGRSSVAAMISPQQRGRPTYLSEATRQLTDLSRTVELEPCAERLLADGIKHAMQGWGDKVIPDQVPDWRSFCSEDHSPVEYSVAIDYRTGAAQLRYLVEPQADEATLEAFQARALEFVGVLDQQYQDTVSLDRVKAIQDIFLPTDGEARGSLRRFSAKLGMEEAYEVITQTMERADIPFLFALDLNPGPDSRVKVYFEHPNGMAADIAAKLAVICPQINPKEVGRFLVTMSGGSPGPYRGKPAGTCIAFKMGEDGRLKTPEGTIYFPISEYTPP